MAPLRELRTQVTVFGSNLILNLSLFGIMLAASLELTAEEFTKLSLATSSIGMLASWLDFGLNQSCLKLALEQQRFSFVALNVTIKAIIFAAVCVALLGVSIVAPSRELVVLAAAAGTAFWAASRVVEQYERRFERLALLNLALTAARLLFGGFAVLTKSWVLIVLAVHVLAQVPVHAVSLGGTVRRAVGRIEWRDLRQLALMSPPMFVSACLYGALPVITQAILYRTGDLRASSAFGVVLLFLAPVSLVIVTLRVYLLPQVLRGSLNRINAFGLGQGSVHALTGGLLLLFCLGLLSAFTAIDWLYGSKYPDAARFFAVYVSAYSLTSVVGLYNIRSQRGRLMWLDLLANAFRAVGTAAPALLSYLTSSGIVTWSATVLIAGEVGLFLMLSLPAFRYSEGASSGTLTKPL